MPIKTLDVDVLASQTGSVFEAVAIVGKRARQISSKMKAELDDKLSYYEGFETELDDPRFQEEQGRISLEYELKPKPTEFAVREMLEGEIYFRNPSADGGEEASLPERTML
jgi:DNA-directed RNA polymerase subunit K/omega